MAYFQIGNGSKNKKPLRLPYFTESSRIKPSGYLRRSQTVETKKQPEFTVWRPNPDKDGQRNPQRLALETEADELYYGGAAGGGKTDLLLGCALTQHRQAVIFRRIYPNLKAIIRRSVEIVGGEEQYRKSEKIWELGDGRFLEFGSVQYEDDKRSWQGRPHDFYGFDEITEFTRSQYQFIIGWNRTTHSGQRCRVICAGNPPLDADGMWIIEEFAPWLDDTFSDPAQPGELRWYYYDGDGVLHWQRTDAPVSVDGESIRPRSRTFIPASLSDNPHLAEDGRYISVLNSLPEPMRTRLKNGDFRAVQGIDPWQVIPTEWVQAAQRRWAEREQPSGEPDCVGVDVARGGRDKTVFAPRWGSYFGEPERTPGLLTSTGPLVAGLFQQSYKAPGYINIDVIGVGSSAFDSVFAMYPSTPVQPINVGAGSTYTDNSGRLKMRNLRSEAFWRMRDALDPANGSDIALPPGNEVVADLCSARYQPLANGIVQVESKDDIKKRLGRSPDVGDALLLANLPLIFDYSDQAIIYEDIVSISPY